MEHSLELDPNRELNSVIPLRGDGKMVYPFLFGECFGGCMLSHRK